MALIYNLFGAITIGLVIVAKPALLVRPSVEEFFTFSDFGYLSLDHTNTFDKCLLFFRCRCRFMFRVPSGPFAALTAFILFSETLSK